MIQYSGIPYSILRTTQFHNFVLLLIKNFAIDNTSIIVPQGLKFQSIDIKDVADILVELTEENPQGKIPDVGGPQILDIDELTEIYLVSRGKENIKIESQYVGGDLYDLFRKGINICPENTKGKFTWKEFLSSNQEWKID